MSYTTVNAKVFNYKQNYTADQQITELKLQNVSELRYEIFHIIFKGLASPRFCNMFDHRIWTFSLSYTAHGL